MSLPPIICANCGRIYDLPEHLSYGPCVACQTINCRPQVEGESLDRLQRATRLRLDGNHGEALKCYEHVLVDYDDEHSALWGKLLCQYGVEFVTDPKTGVRHATVHVPQSRPMQLHADFRRACELAPEEVRAQYEADAAYVDEALAEINRHKESSPPYDVFICHKKTHLNGPGYTEDFNRGVQLTMFLTAQGYRVFFAPFANLTPGASYEAGIYYALWSARAMLLISSDAAFLTSPWVKSEWTRYLEMLDDGADKHLIPLMYDRFPDGRMPREIRLRGLQSIRMDSDLDAKEKLLAAVAKFTGKAASVPQAEPVKQQPTSAPKAEPVGQQPTSAPRTEPVRQQPMSAPKAEPVRQQPTSAPRTEPVRQQPVPAPKAEPVRQQPVPALKVEPVRQQPTSAPQTEPVRKKPAQPDAASATRPENGKPKTVFYTSEKDFETENVTGGVAITKYRGPGGAVSIPPTIGGKRVVEIGENAFEKQEKLTKVVMPDSVTSIGAWAFDDCHNLTSVSIPESVTSIGDWAFGSCDSLTSVSIPEGVTNIGGRAFWGCNSLTSVSIPEGVTNIGATVFGFCSSLKSVSIPGSVTSIGEGAFWGCDSLTSVSIPEGVTNIEEGAFYGCSSLTSVSIPAKARICVDAFSGCDKLPFLQKLKLKNKGAM